MAEYICDFNGCRANQGPMQEQIVRFDFAFDRAAATDNDRFCIDIADNMPVDLDTVIGFDVPGQFAARADYGW